MRSFDAPASNEKRMWLLDADTARAALLSCTVLFGAPGNARAQESLAQIATIPASCSDPSAENAACRADVAQMLERLKSSIQQGALPKESGLLRNRTKTAERCKLAADFFEEQAPELEKIIAFAEYLLASEPVKAALLRNDKNLLQGVATAFKKENGGREPTNDELVARLRTNLKNAPTTLRQCSGELYLGLASAFSFPVAGLTQRTVADRMSGLLDLIGTDLADNAEQEDIARLLPAARALDGILKALRAAASK